MALGGMGKVWGPPKWKLLEETSRAAGMTEAFITDFTASLPSCCRPHWEAMLAATPPPYGASATAQWEWSWTRHNEVNRLRGVPEMPMEEAERRYPPMAQG